jgi:hypothetical protein
MSHHGVRFQSLKDIACHRLLSTGRHHRGSVSADPEASEKPWRKIWGSANWVPCIQNDAIHGSNSQPHLHHALRQSDGSRSFLGSHQNMPPKKCRFYIRQEKNLMCRLPVHRRVEDPRPWNSWVRKRVPLRLAPLTKNPAAWPSPKCSQLAFRMYVCCQMPGGLTEVTWSNCFLCVFHV